MSKGLEQTLREMLTNPGLAAAQLDLAQAAALARQRASFKQRTGAALAQLRRAQEDGRPAEEIAALEAEVARRKARLQAAEIQARTADVKRPAPEPKRAQVFGFADATAEKPPLTLAALSPAGEVKARAVGRANGTFHLSHEGDLNEVTLQVSDAAERVLFRATGPVSIAAGRVLYLDVPLGPPQPEPGPVPTQPTMPAVTGQSEGVALALLRRLGRTDVEVIDEIGEGQPGIVLAQTPKAGTVLAPSVKIALTVRRAGDEPERRVLPDFVGEPGVAAERKLKQLGIAFTVELKASEGPVGRVLAQAPPGGTPLDKVTGVVLTVSEATHGEAVAVPDLSGRPREAAVRLLKAASLKAVITDTADAEAPTGVIKQVPAAGAIVPLGATVHVTVNKPRKRD